MVLDSIEETSFHSAMDLADMSSSVHANNKKRNNLVLGKGFTQGLDNATIYAEKIHPINFTKTNNKFCLSSDIHKFKTKDSETIAAPICLGNISRYFSADNMKKTELNGYVYDFSVDYDAITKDKISDIHKYLMEKNNII